MGSSEWLQNFIESVQEDEGFVMYGDPDYYSESGRDTLSRIKKTAVAVIDAIIEKIQDLAIKFRLQFAKYHFKASFNKLGKSAAVQIQSLGVPKEYNSVVKKAIALDKKIYTAGIALYAKFESGKITADEFDRQVIALRKQGEAGGNALAMQFDTIIGAMRDTVIVKTNDIMQDYDKAISSLVDQQANFTKQTCQGLNSLKKRVAQKSTNPAAAAIQAAGNKIAALIGAIHSAIMKLLSKITSKIANLANKDLNKAGKTVKHESFEGYSLDLVITEEWQDIFEEIMVDSGITA